MAITLGVVGYNSTLKIGSTLITEVKDITGPNITFETADFTHMSSPSGYKEIKPTYKSGGQVTFRVNYVHSDASHKSLIAAAVANPPTQSFFTLGYPDGSAFQFSAYTGISWSSPMAGPIEMNVTLTLDGEVVWQGASSPSVSKSSSASVSAS